MKLAFIGLGVMGSPMAAHLARAGHTVTVFNRTDTRAAAWVAAHGGTRAATPKEAAAGADVVLVCVGDDDDVRAVVLGPNGALAGMVAGTLLVDHTTASADLARELAAVCDEAAIGFVDAPVSGGQAGAEKGQLSVMCGGRDEDVARAREVFAAYAKAVAHQGPVGSGQLCKMVNQICIAGVLAGLSEGLAFAQQAGLDPERVIAAIRNGAAQSWQMENRWRTMVAGEFEFGFAVDLMLKDLDICQRTADAVGVQLPITEEVAERYAEVSAMGGGRWDTSSLIALLQSR
jgi:3-hydroxyisobutyrate dehydrogenase